MGRLISSLSQQASSYPDFVSGYGCESTRDLRHMITTWIKSWILATYLLVTKLSLLDEIVIGKCASKVQVSAACDVSDGCSRFWLCLYTKMKNHQIIPPIGWNPMNSYTHSRSPTMAVTQHWGYRDSDNKWSHPGFSHLTFFFPWSSFPPLAYLSVTENKFFFNSQKTFGRYQASSTKSLAASSSPNLSVLQYLTEW